MPEHTPAPTPNRAVYGFAMYLSFKLLFILYLLWAVLPESLFHYIGITCLPQRYWAIAVPIFFLTVVAAFGFVIYPCLNLCMTPNIDDVVTVHEKKFKECTKNASFEEFLINNDKDACHICCKDPKGCKRAKFFEMQEVNNSISISPVKYLTIGTYKM
ncbi:phosphatidylinositol N-acetylglucosaminyltransferase subunit P-like isoform X1 [Agrilus planipennis]|uniref:Phosphatidylinositol N-acetylglucosaminyltransferase subunit P-like isoform X1 n=1 Tax=Agrilus planipennis TaxID=224129 RepID=A0A1W4XAQ1_AGRPL|nr:phosphatidylinositol N-acetylglucosaminyltransferase subunit P-like isoform X1 [Agrilus planipennis]XP_025831492.1 phosphatidylinositol N-acetylglucosaminyltransferase subunit P-like isoform X1 [Agrilus planipennis]